MKPYCAYCGKGPEECICEEGSISPKDWLEFFKTKGMKETVMKEIPPCDFCEGGEEARYDVKTKMGPWAYLCEYHYVLVGTRIGTKLVKE